MNQTEALELIKIKSGLEDSALRNALAESSLQSAVSMFDILGEYTWNQQYVTFTLSSGTSLFYMSDLVVDYEYRKLNDEGLWFTDRRGYVDLKNTEEFNEYKRGSTSSGRPRVGVIHSRESILEVYPTPDADYEVWAMIGVKTSTISQLPTELHLFVVNLAVMAMTPADSPHYIAAANIWGSALPMIEKTKFHTVWRGNQVKPGVVRFGNNDSGSSYDSYNPFDQ